MTHLAYVAASYGLAAMLMLWLGLGAVLRTAAAQRRLRALDPRLDKRLDKRLDERLDERRA